MIIKFLPYKLQYSVLSELKSGLFSRKIVFGFNIWKKSSSWSDNNYLNEEKVKGQPEAVEIMKVLNVAEKNDASKRIAALLSNGRAQTRNTHSTFNKIYQFPYNFQDRNCEMLMTSVSGHLLGYDFTDRHRKWYSCEPVELFDAPVVKMCLENYQPILRTLQEQARICDILVIWTDCDREGEGIGFEVIDVCTAINPRLNVYRAKFSELTPTAITRAWRNLERPNKNMSDAVDVRSELDLRIGAAFTRFQTMRLQKRFPTLADKLISYGSCQFPTLGFVVERYKAIQNFVPEEFWKIEVSHKVEECTVDFNWARVRLFNKLAVQILYEKCMDNPLAKVVSVQSKPKSKWRPVALDTVEFEKLSSRKLRINAKEAMRIAEKLYTQGIISYPRTETNIFPKGLDLVPLVEGQTNSPQWGGFAQRLLQDGPNPRNGKNTDQAHPPIHPTRFDASLQGNDAKVYELIVRHFLACCSKDAKGHETTVEIEIAGERFIGHGLQVLERNYLEVYIYEKWSDKELPTFQQGETFQPRSIEMNESSTAPPSLLTEADLISLMEKHGIGTDATHADHIETIKSRLYVGVQDGKFVPGLLGMGLVEGYDTMGFEMSKPHLRAELEADLKRICEGQKDPQVVLQEQIRKYRVVFVHATDQVVRLDDAVGKFLNQGMNGPPPSPPPPPRNPPGAGRGRGRGGRRDSSEDEDDDNNLPPPPPRARAQPRTPAPPRNTGAARGRGGGRGDYDDNQTQGNYRPPPPNNYQPPTNNYQPPTNNYQSPINNYQSQRGNYQPPPPNNYQSQRPPNNYPPDDEEIPMCKCNIPGVSRTVKKEGPNKGKLFFACSKQMGDPDKCDFFAWDEKNTGAQPQQRPTPNYNNQTNAFVKPTRGRGRAARGRGAGRQAPAGGPRKCSVCKEPGHTKRNCPVSVQADLDGEEDMSFY